MIETLLKPYVFCVATRRESFSVAFTAMDDAAAEAHAARWLAKNSLPEDSSSCIVGPDGRVVAALKRAAPGAAADLVSR